MGEKWVEIFRAGKYPKWEFTEDHLDHIVKSYDPKVHQAPVVIGHPRLNEPAVGWVDGLKREGKTLLATFADVNPKFAQLVNQGAYRKRSASFYPLPGGEWYLRHVGYLGAIPPVVKGLADMTFAEGEECSGKVFQAAEADANFAENGEIADFSDWDERGIFQRLRDFLAEKYDADTAEKIIPQAALDGMAWEDGYEAGRNQQPAPSEATNMQEVCMSEETEKLTKDLALARADAERRQSELTALEAKFAELEAAGHRKGIKDRLDRLQAEGKVSPALRKRGLEEFLSGLEAKAECQFAEGDGGKMTPLEFAFGLLDGKKGIDFGEKFTHAAAGAGAGAEVAVPAEFSESDPDQVAVWQKAKKIQRDKGIDFPAALRLARE